jgi:undecaprenyl diphosphate synthase
MSRLARFLKDNRDEFADSGVELRAIGQLDRLPGGVRKELERAIELTSGGQELTLVLALSYGGRQEITRAAQAIARKAKEGELAPEEVDEALLGRHLYTSGLPDPDLLIRTGGERRLSNFLLWQLWYTEIYVTDTYWPDFDEAALREALWDYAGRSRRFGGLKEEAPPAAQQKT